MVNVILDGQVNEENLKRTGNNSTWLERQLHKQGYHNASESSDGIMKLIENDLVKPGDLAYCTDNVLLHADPYHATIVSYVENNDILYAAHTDNYINRSMDLVLNNNKDNEMKFYIVHLKDVFIYE